MEKKNTFHLTIKTPDEKALDSEVKSLIVDSEEGKMMILPHHTTLVGSISFSNITISQGDKLSEYSIRNGFLYVNNELNTVEIFCLNCEKTQTVKYTTVESYLKFLENELDSQKLNQYQLEFLESEKFAVVKQLDTMERDK